MLWDTPRILPGYSREMLQEDALGGCYRGILRGWYWGDAIGGYSGVVQGDTLGLCHGLILQGDTLGR